jgi:hypothetical protein
VHSESATRTERVGAGKPSRCRRIELEEFDVEIDLELAPRDVEAAVARVTDPAAAEETLHWGRNYLYVMELESVAGPLEVVVKQFRHQGLIARARRRWSASKATKSWRAAVLLVGAGIPTARPVLLAESRAAEGASFFVTERLRDVVESRFIFRALAAGTERELFPRIDRAGLMRALGRLCRQLHEAGVWHRDISIGNLMVRPRAEGSEPEVFILDLNRARVGRRLGLVRRTRDLCRMPLPSNGDRRELLTSYWGEPVERGSLRDLLLAVFARTFLLRNRLKAAARGPLKSVRRLARARRAYTHIPAPSPAAAARDKAVWDHLSDQPHQHATRAERARIRVADVGAHAEATAAAVRTLPAIWRRYRRLAKRTFAARLAWPGTGVALRPRSEDPEGLLSALADSRATHVLLRLHPWQREHGVERELAAELSARGYDLAFAVPQNRELVKDLPRWRDAVEELAGIFRPFGRCFQIGQAVNRSKWGVWNYREYLELVAIAGDILRRTPDTLVLGPAVIDFELQATAAIVNMRREDVLFDVVTSLLYVDRRGAPENRQLGFDSVAKATLLRAIAETGRNSGSECWVTEVNWPLREGPHAPAGRDVAVDEETQANFLVRYYLELLTSGMIARVYWWQLVARGYGLTVPTADGTLRRRPAHRALAALDEQLSETSFEERLPTPSGAWLLRFRRRDDEELLVGWSESDATEITLPRAATAVFDRDGRKVATEGREVRLLPTPRYFRLAAEA